MTDTQLILERLSTIEQQLSMLIVPVARQIGKQQASMTKEEIKENNKQILARSRARRKGVLS